jgi:hypothetical protein
VEVGTAATEVAEGWGEHDPLDEMEEVDTFDDILEEGELSGVWCGRSNEEEDDECVSSTPAKHQRV